MKRDLPGAIRRIAAFLEIAIDEAQFPKIVEHCSFDYMKAHAATVAPLGGVFWHGGAQTFVNKGTNGRWRETLSSDEVATYETRALAELGSDCAWWLAMGEGSAG
jgi:aryl sulfotransferase